MTLSVLRLDKVFQKIAGLDDYSVQSLISRFLKRFTLGMAKAIAKVNTSLWRKERKRMQKKQGRRPFWGKFVQLIGEV